MTRETLTAILTTTRDTDGLYLSDGSYIDWSAPTADGGRTLDVGQPDGQAVLLDLSWADLEALVHRLAATLLAG